MKAAAGSSADPWFQCVEWRRSVDAVVEARGLSLCIVASDEWPQGWSVRIIRGSRPSVAGMPNPRSSSAGVTMWQTWRISNSAHSWPPAWRRSSARRLPQNSVRIAGMDSGERWGHSSWASPNRAMRVRALPLICRMRNDDDRTISPVSWQEVESRRVSCRGPLSCDHEAG